MHFKETVATQFIIILKRKLFGRPVNIIMTLFQENYNAKRLHLLWQKNFISFHWVDSFLHFSPSIGWQFCCFIKNLWLLNFSLEIAQLYYRYYIIDVVFRKKFFGGPNLMIYVEVLNLTLKSFELEFWLQESCKGILKKLEYKKK